MSEDSRHTDENQKLMELRRAADRISVPSLPPSSFSHLFDSAVRELSREINDPNSPAVIVAGRKMALIQSAIQTLSSLPSAYFVKTVDYDGVSRASYFERVLFLSSLTFRLSEAGSCFCAVLPNILLIVDNIVDTVEVDDVFLPVMAESLNNAALALRWLTHSVSSLPLIHSSVVESLSKLTFIGRIAKAAVIALDLDSGDSSPNDNSFHTYLHQNQVGRYVAANFCAAIAYSSLVTGVRCAMKNCTPPAVVGLHGTYLKLLVEQFILPLMTSPASDRAELALDRTTISLFLRAVSWTQVAQTTIPMNSVFRELPVQYEVIDVSSFEPDFPATFHSLSGSAESECLCSPSSSPDSQLSGWRSAADSTFPQYLTIKFAYPIIPRRIQTVSADCLQSSNIEYDLGREDTGNIKYFPLGRIQSNIQPSPVRQPSYISAPVLYLRITFSAPSNPQQTQVGLRQLRVFANESETTPRCALAPPSCGESLDTRAQSPLHESVSISAEKDSYQINCHIPPDLEGERQERIEGCKAFPSPLRELLSLSPDHFSSLLRQFHTRATNCGDRMMESCLGSLLALEPRNPSTVVPLLLASLRRVRADFMPQNVVLWMADMRLGLCGAAGVAPQLPLDLRSLLGMDGEAVAAAAQLLCDHEQSVVDTLCTCTDELQCDLCRLRAHHTRLFSPPESAHLLIASTSPKILDALSSPSPRPVGMADRDVNMFDPLIGLVGLLSPESAGEYEASSSPGGLSLGTGQNLRLRKAAFQVVLQAAERVLQQQGSLSGEQQAALLSAATLSRSPALLSALFPMLTPLSAHALRAVILSLLDTVTTDSPSLAEDIEALAAVPESLIPTSTLCDAIMEAQVSSDSQIAMRCRLLVRLADGEKCRCGERLSRYAFSEFCLARDRHARDEAVRLLMKAVGEDGLADWLARTELRDAKRAAELLKTANSQLRKLGQAEFTWRHGCFCPTDTKRAEPASIRLPQAAGIVSLAASCQFCGFAPEIPEDIAKISVTEPEVAIDFISWALSAHEATQCPYLCACPFCDQVVTFPLLSAHLSSQCRYHEQGQRPYTQCTRCQRLINWSEHSLHASVCSDTLDASSFYRCPACDTVIPRDQVVGHYTEKPGCPGNVRTIRV